LTLDGRAIVLYKKDIWRSRSIANAVCIINCAFSRAVVDFFPGSFMLILPVVKKLEDLITKLCNIPGVLRIQGGNKSIRKKFLKTIFNGLHVG